MRSVSSIRWHTTTRLDTDAVSWYGLVPGLDQSSFADERHAFLMAARAADGLGLKIHFIIDNKALVDTINTIINSDDGENSTTAPSTRLEAFASHDDCKQAIVALGKKQR